MKWQKLSPMSHLCGVFSRLTSNVRNLAAVRPQIGPDGHPASAALGYVDQRLTPMPAHHTLAVVDVETTGLSANYDRVVEVFAQLVVVDSHGRFVDFDASYHSLHDPGIRIPGEAIAVHGITNAKGQGTLALPNLSAGAWLRNCPSMAWTVRACLVGRKPAASQPTRRSLQHQRDRVVP